MKPTSIVFAILGLWLSISLPSCQNPCGAIECQNDGVCIDGACQCPKGFGGNDCTTITSTFSAKVNGSTWNATLMLFHEADDTQFFPTLAASNETQSFQFGFVNGTAPGSYLLHDSLIPNKPASISWNIPDKTYNAADGELIITRDESDRLEGIFHFTGVEIYDYDTVFITDGTFSIEK